MKKSLLAVAIAALVPGAVMAQTNVTLFGVADVGVTRRAGDGNGSVLGMGSSLFSSSRFGVRGTEDLGGGLRAGFWLETQLGVDDGTNGGGSGRSNTNNQASGAATDLAMMFNRRSTVSLMGGFGEVRLGRDFVPSFWNHTMFDPFGTLGIGAATANTARILGVTAVRASNSIGYFLPGNLGGFYGQAMYALGENASTAANKNDGRYVGARLGYKAGAFEIAGSHGRTEYLAGDITNNNIAGSFQMGPARLMAQFNTQKNEANAVGNREQRDILLGGTYTMGATTLRASYVDSNVKDTDADARRFTIGVSQALSKRTSLYAAYGVMDNKANGTLFTNGRAVTTAGGRASGFDLGVAHSF
jgi:predicted porin